MCRGIFGRSRLLHDKNFVKSPIMGLIRIFIAQMPFPEDACGIAGILKHFCDGCCLEGHPFPFPDRMGDPFLKGTRPVINAARVGAQVGLA